jgi:hypothetical protein
MFSALGQKLGSQVSPQGLQSIQLLIGELRAAAYAGLRNLVQPFLSIARGTDPGAGAGNAQPRNSAFSRFITRVKSLPMV